jgi:hypothetical protein
MEGSSLIAALAAPLMLPASVIGAMVALLVVLLVLLFRRAEAPVSEVLLPVVALLVAGLAAIAVLDHMTQNERAAERRTIEQRATELSAQALALGSALGCLDSAAGDAVEAACEKAVFESPQSTAAAVAYVAARLNLLADGLAFAHHTDPDFADRLSGLRRAIELDRFGIAAHILSSRDGCTPQRCAAFALLRNASAIKANLRVHAYHDYVARHAAAWNKPPAAEPQTPVASVPPPAEPKIASGPPNPPTEANPVPSRFNFPSADSIPRVSIMNPEPPLLRGASSVPAPAAATTASVPVPPPRPQIPMQTAPAR